ncbi:MAG: peptidase S8/S53 subtilisin kexin sedolisin, partial [Exiguobacterium sp.]|nr:peptidase S8/S53 subtilisin kexin sedolisin [Exiguobacterium sp.]
QKKEITVSIDVSKAKVLNPETLEGTVSAKSVFENGYFVDGFLRLTDPRGTDGHPSLVVPIVGFEGDWGKAPIFDETIYGEGAFYGVSGLVDAEGKYLGEKLDESVASEAVAISPDGDGSKDTATPVFSLLRNAKDIKYRVVDEKGNVLRTLKMEDELRKNYFDGGSGDYYYYAADNAWDGKLNGKMAPKGTYYYEIEASIDYMKKQAQTMRIPVKVDYTDPRFTLRWDDNVASVKASDDFAGINGIEFLINGKVVAKEAKASANFTLEQPLETTDQLSVRVSDNAGNVITRNVSTENDVAKPGIFVDAPLALSPYGTSIVPLIGQIKDASEIASFTVDGVDVPLKYDASAKQYTFNTTRTYKDGFHKVRFVAEDTAGNVTNFVRPIFVDSTKAKLSVTNVPKNVSSKQNSVKVKVQVTDNFDEIKLRVNGDLKWSNTLKEPYAMRAFSRTGTITLPVTAKGKNTFTFEVTDLGGNVTKKVITINKK